MKYINGQEINVGDPVVFIKKSEFGLTTNLAFGEVYIVTDHFITVITKYGICYDVLDTQLISI